MDIDIEEAIDFHNNRILKSTGFKPADLKDIDDENIINEVISNIIKSMQRKIKFDKKALKNTLLLICQNICFLSGKYILQKSKGKKTFTIPAKLLDYTNSNTIRGEIKINYNSNLNFNVGDIINISADCCRIIDDFGYNYYLKKNGKNLDFPEIEKLALLED